MEYWEFYNNGSDNDSDDSEDNRANFIKNNKP